MHVLRENRVRDDGHFFKIVINILQVVEIVFMLAEYK